MIKRGWSQKMKILMLPKTDAVTVDQIKNCQMTIGLRNLSETLLYFKVFSRGLEEKCVSKISYNLMFLETDAVTLCQITNSYMTIGLRNLSETFQCFKVFSMGLEEKCCSQNI